MNYIKPFFYGILAAFSALVLETIFSILTFNDGDTNERIFAISILMIFLAAVTEETLKYIFIRKTYLEMEDQAKIISLSLILGLGFSSVELLSNLLKNNSLDNLGNIYFWGVLFLHLVTSSFFGLMFLKSEKKGTAFAATILVSAIIIHLSYNAAVLYLFK
jgi:hypothetical protein